MQEVTAVQGATARRYQGITCTGYLVVAGLPIKISAVGDLPFSNVITILKSVSMLSGREGSAAQHMAWGRLNVSANSVRRNVSGDISLDNSPAQSFDIDSQSVYALSKRIGEPLSQAGSFTSRFSKKWFVCTMIPCSFSLR